MLKYLCTLLLIIFTLQVGFSQDTKNNVAPKQPQKEVNTKSGDTYKDIIERSDEKNISEGERKRYAKMFKPLPEQIFTKLRFLVDFGVHFTKMGDYGKYLKAEGFGEPYGLLFANFNFVWQFNGYLGGGFKIGGGLTSVNKKTYSADETTKYMYLKDFKYVNIGPVISLIPYMNDDFLVDLQLSGGLISLGINEETITTTKPSYQDYVLRKYVATSYYLDAGLIFNYRLNKLWAIGIGGGYIYANFKKVTDEVNDETKSVTNSNDINFSGGYAKIQMQFGF